MNPAKRPHKRRSYSCGPCKHHKTKCDHLIPCTSCLRYRREDLCRLQPATPPLPKPQKVKRLRIIEAIPKGLSTSLPTGQNVPAQRLAVGADMPYFDSNHAGTGVSSLNPGPPLQALAQRSPIGSASSFNDSQSVSVSSPDQTTPFPLSNPPHPSAATATLMTGQPHQYQHAPNYAQDNQTKFNAYSGQRQFSIPGQQYGQYDQMDQRYIQPPPHSHPQPKSLTHPRPQPQFIPQILPAHVQFANSQSESHIQKVNTGPSEQQSNGIDGNVPRLDPVKTTSINSQPVFSGLESRSQPIQTLQSAVQSMNYGLQNEMGQDEFLRNSFKDLPTSKIILTKITPSPLHNGPSPSDSNLGLNSPLKPSSSYSLTPSSSLSPTTHPDINVNPHSNAGGSDTVAITSPLQQSYNQTDEIATLKARINQLEDVVGKLSGIASFSYASLSGTDSGTDMEFTGDEKNSVQQSNELIRISSEGKIQASVSSIPTYQGPIFDVWNMMSSEMNWRIILLRALPSRQHCQVFVDYYLSDVDWIYHPLHNISFIKQLNAFWNDETENVDLIWLSQLLMILSLSALHLPVNIANQLNIKQEVFSLRQASALWFRAARQALQAGNFDENPVFPQLQTFSLMQLYLYATNQIALINSLLGQAMRHCIQLGLHVDSPGANVLETELRRRMWWDICGCDTFQALCGGRPILVNSYDSQVPFPVNCHEEDMSPDCVIARPSNVHTVMSFQIERNMAMKILNKLFNNIGEQQPTFEEALQTDMELCAYANNMPWFFQLSDTGTFRDTDPDGNPVDLPETLLFQQHMMHTCICMHRFRIHQEFLQPRVPISWEICILSAKAMFGVYRLLRNRWGGNVCGSYKFMAQIHQAFTGVVAQAMVLLVENPNREDAMLLKYDMDNFIEDLGFLAGSFKINIPILTEGMSIITRIRDIIERTSADGRKGTTTETVPGIAGGVYSVFGGKKVTEKYLERCAIDFLMNTDAVTQPEQQQQQQQQQPSREDSITSEQQSHEAPRLENRKATNLEEARSRHFQDSLQQRASNGISTSSSPIPRSESLISSSGSSSPEFPRKSELVNVTISGMDQSRESEQFDSRSSSSDLNSDLNTDMSSALRSGLTSSVRSGLASVTEEDIDMSGNAIQEATVTTNDDPAVNNQASSTSSTSTSSSSLTDSTNASSTNISDAAASDYYTSWLYLPPPDAIQESLKFYQQIQHEDTPPDPDPHSLKQINILKYSDWDVMLKSLIPS